MFKQLTANKRLQASVTSHHPHHPPPRAVYTLVFLSSRCLHSETQKFICDAEMFSDVHMCTKQHATAAESFFCTFVTIKLVRSVGGLIPGAFQVV